MHMEDICNGGGLSVSQWDGFHPFSENAHDHKADGLPIWACRETMGNKVNRPCMKWAQKFQGGEKVQHLLKLSNFKLNKNMSRADWRHAESMPCHMYKGLAY